MACCPMSETIFFFFIYFVWSSSGCLGRKGEPVSVTPSWLEMKVPEC